MANLLPKMIMTGLAAAISPIAVMLLIAVMLKGHARRNSLLFLLGFTITLLLIGVIGMALFHLGGTAGHHSKVGGYIDFGLGVLCLLLIPYTLLKKPKKKKETRGEEKPLAAFTTGVVAMCVNSTTIVIYISGLHLIGRAKLPLGDDVIALIVLTFFTLITLLIPICIYFIVPSRADKLLESLGGWLARHNKVIGAAILLVFGIYLVIRGLKVIV